MNKFMPLLTLDNKPLVLKGAMESATLTIKTQGTPTQTTAQMKHIDENGEFSDVQQINYTNDIVVATIVRGFVTVDTGPFSMLGVKDASGVTWNYLPTYNRPNVLCFYVTDANASITLYNYD